MQSNGLLALCGLVSAVNEYAASLDDVGTETEMKQYMTMSHWTLTMAETVMAVLDLQYVPASRIIAWGQSVSENGIYFHRSFICTGVF